jgi:hypothetical protein
MSKGFAFEFEINKEENNCYARRVVGWVLIKAFYPLT